MTLVDLWIAFPLLILAVGAILTLILGAITKAQKAVLVLAIITSTGAGIWAMQTPAAQLAPTLNLSAAGLTRLFTVCFTFMSTAVLVLSHGYNIHRNIRGEEYSATILFTTFGMVALASATDLLILFLGLETLTYGFYILTAIDRERTVSGEAGLKFLLMGLLSSTFMVFGIALLYCVAGTLKIDEVMRLTLTTSAAGDPIALAGWACILIGMAFKLSLVPAHLWTPDIYDAAPAPVVAFISGGSKGAAVLLLILLLPHADDTAILRIPLFVLALLSMLVGNLAALLQCRIRRMLAYSSIAQMGYVALALINYSGEGMQAAAFYAIAYGIMSLAAFGAIGVLEANGCGENLDDYRGRGFTHPIAGGVLAISMFSLAGIPPSVGFTGKFLIFSSALRAGEIVLAIIGILTAAISIYYYLKVVTVLYLQQSEKKNLENINVFETAVLGISAALIILLGLFPSQLLDFLKTQLF